MDQSVQFIIEVQYQNKFYSLKLKKVIKIIFKKKNSFTSYYVLANAKEKLNFPPYSRATHPVNHEKRLFIFVGLINGETEGVSFCLLLELFFLLFSFSQRKAGWKTPIQRLAHILLLNFPM